MNINRLSKAGSLSIITGNGAFGICSLLGVAANLTGSVTISAGLSTGGTLGLVNVTGVSVIQGSVTITSNYAVISGVNISGNWTLAGSLSVTAGSSSSSASIGGISLSGLRSVSSSVTLSAMSAGITSVVFADAPTLSIGGNLTLRASTSSSTSAAMSNISVSTTSGVVSVSGFVVIAGGGSPIRLVTILGLQSIGGLDVSTYSATGWVFDMILHRMT